MDDTTSWGKGGDGRITKVSPDGVDIDMDDGRKKSYHKDFVKELGSQYSSPFRIVKDDEEYAKGGEIEYMDYDELMEVVMEENSSNQNEKLAKEIAKIQGFKYDAVDYADFHLVVRDYLDGSTNKNDDEAREVLIQAFENTGIEYDDDDDEYAKGGRPRKDTDDILTLGELAFKDTMNNEDGHWDSFDFYKHGYNSVRAGSKSNYIGFGEKDHNVKGDDGWYDEELGKYLSNDQEVALMYTDVDSDGYEIAIVEYLKPLKEIKIKNKKK